LHTCTWVLKLHEYRDDMSLILTLPEVIATVEGYGVKFQA
jgi:hypothetical protein